MGNIWLVKWGYSMKNRSKTMKIRWRKPQYPEIAFWDDYNERKLSEFWSQAYIR